MQRWWARIAIALILTLGLSADAAAATTPHPDLPPYPAFPSDSCFIPHESKLRVLRHAPSYLPPAPAVKPRPAALLASVLEGLSGTSGIKIGRVGPLPRAGPGWKWPAFPPKPRWLYLDAPLATDAGSNSSPQSIVAHIRARWEATLVAGSLRDLMCWNRERPLVGWSPNAAPGADDLNSMTSSIAFGQIFPNPTVAEFREKVNAAAREYNLTLVALKVLVPFQLAPAVVFKAKNTELGTTVSNLIADLYRTADGEHDLFEGYFLEIRGPDGVPIAARSSTFRGVSMGSSWSPAPRLIPRGRFDPCSQQYALAITDTGFPSSGLTIPCLKITFNLRNLGTTDHGFTILGLGESGVGPVVPPGQAALFTVTLPRAAVYKVQSDVPGDAERGVVWAFAVQSGGAARCSRESITTVRMSPSQVPGIAFGFSVPQGVACGPNTFLIVNETDSDHNFTILGLGDAGVSPVIPAGGPPIAFTVTLAPGNYRYQSDVNDDSKRGLAGAFTAG